MTPVIQSASFWSGCGFEAGATSVMHLVGHILAVKSPPLKSGEKQTEARAEVVPDQGHLT
jgi:hypothetical protein